MDRGSECILKYSKLAWLVEGEAKKWYGKKILVIGNLDTKGELQFLQNLFTGTPCHSYGYGNGR